jgi:hypothetical protein
MSFVVCMDPLFSTEIPNPNILSETPPHDAPMTPVQEMLLYFKYDHLTDSELKAASRPFCELANTIAAYPLNRMVEHGTFNPVVVRSSRTRSTTFFMSNEDKKTF